MVNVRYYPEIDVTQAEAGSATPDEISELDQVVESYIREGASASDMRILSWAGTKRRLINGLYTFVSDYRRASMVGDSPFRVRLIRVFAAERSFTLTVSYSERDEQQMLPVTDRIIGSLRLEQHQDEN